MLPVTQDLYLSGEYLPGEVGDAVRNVHLAQIPVVMFPMKLLCRLTHLLQIQLQPVAGRCPRVNETSASNFFMANSGFAPASNIVVRAIWAKQVTAQVLWKNGNYL